MTKNILVIDDEELVIKTISRLLRSAGYATYIAKTADEALDNVKDRSFDLIISDIRMPGTDGVEAVRQIRAYLRKSNKRPVPEVLITGYADLEKYNEAMELKVVDYLYKPFDNDDLLRVVKKTIG